MNTTISLVDELKQLALGDTMYGPSPIRKAYRSFLIGEYMKEALMDNVRQRQPITAQERVGIIGMPLRRMTPCLYGPLHGLLMPTLGGPWVMSERCAVFLDTASGERHEYDVHWFRGTPSQQFKLRGHLFQVRRIYVYAGQRPPQQYSAVLAELYTSQDSRRIMPDVRERIIAWEEQQWQQDGEETADTPTIIPRPQG